MLMVMPITLMMILILMRLFVVQLSFSCTGLGMFADCVVYGNFNSFLR